MERNRLIGDITPKDPSASVGVSPLTPLAVASELAKVTPRDRELLELLDHHGTLTTEQVASWGFGTVGRARNRLNQLRERGVLDRFRHYRRPGSQSWRWVLGPLGAALLAASRDQPLPRASTVRDTAARLASSPNLDHLLAVNGFMIALLSHSRNHGDVWLTRWWNESHSREATGNLVRPDGHGIWAASGRTVPFWLEVDRGTESISRVVGKVSGYANLGPRRAYPVVIWFATSTRENNVHSRLSRMDIPGNVVVATGSAESPHGKTSRPEDAVWRLPGHDERIHLIDLPMPPGMAP